MLDTVIILAAGRGTRLQPLTNDLPKGMVPLHGRPLLAWQVEAARVAGARKIIVVTGHGAASVDLPGVIRVHNERYAETDMVASLMTARGYFGDGFILTNGNVVYEPHVLERVMHCDADVACAVDHDWHRYWDARFEDPLAHAHSLRLRGNQIVEVGQRPASTEQAQGQLAGITSFHPRGIAALETVAGSAYALAASGECIDNGPRLADELRITDVVQALVAREQGPTQVPILGGWLEVVEPSDLELAARMSTPGMTLLEIDRDLAMESMRQR